MWNCPLKMTNSKQTIKTDLGNPCNTCSSLFLRSADKECYMPSPAIPPPFLYSQFFIGQLLYLYGLHNYSHALLSNSNFVYLYYCENKGLKQLNSKIETQDYRTQRGKAWIGLYLPPQNIYCGHGSGQAFCVPGIEDHSISSYKNLHGFFIWTLMSLCSLLKV